MGPPRHVIIADPPPDRAHPELQAAGTAVMDELRKQLAGNARYVLVNHDSMTAALMRSRNRDSVMTWLGGDMNVSIRAYPAASPDSVRWLVSLFDPTSMARGETVNILAGPVNAPAAVADSLVPISPRRRSGSSTTRRDAGQHRAGQPAPATLPQPEQPRHRLGRSSRSGYFSRLGSSDALNK